MGDIEKTTNEIPEPPPTEIKPIKKYTAELIGTMVLVLAGCGSAVIVGLATSYLGYNLG